MTKRERQIFIIIITILFGIFFQKEITVAEETSLELYEIINTDDFFELMQKDEEYLKKELTEDEVFEEIAILSNEIEVLKGDYEKTKKGSLLYHPDTVGKIHALSNAKYNRTELLRNNNTINNFKYEKRKFFTPYGTMNVTIRGIIPKEIRNFNYEQARIVLDNIDIDDKHVENIMVLISPLYFDDMNGYSYSDGSEGRNDMAVISNYSIGLGPESELAIKNVRSTVLHELGHLFHRSQEAKQNILSDSGNMDLNSIDFWQEYFKVYPELKKKDYNSLNWSDSPIESAAEDFRIIYSNKLGEESFEPLEKKTSIGYREDVEEIFEKYESKGKDSSKNSFAKISLNVDDKQIADIPSTAKMAYNYSEKHKDVSIKIDAKDSVFRRYIVHKWDKNGKLITSARLLGDVSEYKLDLNDRDRNVSIVTISVEEGREAIQKWRIDIYRD